MRKFKRETRYLSTITVVVEASQFGGLLDMMRYDSCAPGTQADSARIASLPEALEPVTITLRRFAASGDGATRERWSSFGIRVVDERSPEEVPFTPQA